MDRENVEYTYSGILCSLKKKILRYVTTWMNIEEIMLRRISQSQGQAVHDSAYMRYLT